MTLLCPSPHLSVAFPPILPSLSSLPLPLPLSVHLSLSLPSLSPFRSISPFPSLPLLPHSRSISPFPSLSPLSLPSLFPLPSLSHSSLPLPPFPSPFFPFPSLLLLPSFPPLFSLLFLYLSPFKVHLPPSLHPSSNPASYTPPPPATALLSCCVLKKGWKGRLGSRRWHSLDPSPLPSSLPSASFLLPFSLLVPTSLFFFPPLPSTSLLLPFSLLVPTSLFFFPPFFSPLPSTSFSSPFFASRSFLFLLPSLLLSLLPPPFFSSLPSTSFLLPSLVLFPSSYFFSSLPSISFLLPPFSLLYLYLLSSPLFPPPPFFSPPLPSSIRSSLPSPFPFSSRPPSSLSPFYLTSFPYPFSFLLLSSNPPQISRLLPSLPSFRFFSFFHIPPPSLPPFLISFSSVLRFYLLLSFLIFLPSPFPSPYPKLIQFPFLLSSSFFFLPFPSFTHISCPLLSSLLSPTPHISNPFDSLFFRLPPLPFLPFLPLAWRAALEGSFGRTAWGAREASTRNLRPFIDALFYLHSVSPSLAGGRVRGGVECAWRQSLRPNRRSPTRRSAVQHAQLRWTTPPPLSEDKRQTARQTAKFHQDHVPSPPNLNTPSPTPFSPPHPFLHPPSTQIPSTAKHVSTPPSPFLSRAS
ncbi:hypothetical protein C7M84_003627 [Penaeus vannamei]|uniref:Uncharacterized protein n=1 Tax=Penaeus vannamei TaxID=6689 RepID=A0A3R7PUT9_PENVA|nr:hypothetical protein C7M84_003627 [Penaeus vannamei]